MLSELQPICLIFAAMFSAVFIVAGVSKYREVNRARNWVATTGTVTESKVRSKRQRSSDGDSFESMPLVVYEYYVDGEKYRGNKINFAEKITGEEVAATLNKYPEGKIVQVYYNPARPSEAVLEHELPSAIFKILGIIILVILGLGLAAPFVFDFISRGIETIAPNADAAAPATILFGMGLFALMMAYAMQKQVWNASRDWLVARGKILDTSVQARDSWDSDGHYSKLYNSEVVYSFAVRGQQYISDRVSLGGKFSGSMVGGVPGFVKKMLDKYPVGASVQVYYNPKNPSECALERRVNGIWLLLLVALGLIAGALKMLGLI